MRVAVINHRGREGHVGRTVNRHAAGEISAQGDRPGGSPLRGADRVRGRSQLGVERGLEAVHVADDVIVRVVGDRDRDVGRPKARNIAGKGDGLVPRQISRVVGQNRDVVAGLKRAVRQGALRRRSVGRGRGRCDGPKAQIRPCGCCILEVRQVVA